MSIQVLYTHLVMILKTLSVGNVHCTVYDCRFWCWSQGRPSPLPRAMTQPPPLLSPLHPPLSAISPIFNRDPGVSLPGKFCNLMLIWTRNFSFCFKGNFPWNKKKNSLFTPPSPRGFWWRSLRRRGCLWTPLVDHVGTTTHHQPWSD